MGRMGRCRAVPREPAPWSPASTKATLGTVPTVPIWLCSPVSLLPAACTFPHLTLPADEMKQRLSQVKSIHTYNAK
ncbi:unnamed protein product [Fusarium venenatum]|uniref:Uncharacterized protein n=1 Tax=Fusarium venenatum TaxID=56646 RepID=A0A2L2T182_9HYPO|nr:uncharacterized protein FVRRES_05609 [Fusarium venenatum]CEI61173.1 unnamed protein product [Fusarium venenatum]